jgi:hypothetical protein
MVVNIGKPESHETAALPLAELEAASMPIILLDDSATASHSPTFRVIGVDRRYGRPAEFLCYGADDFAVLAECLSQRIRVWSISPLTADQG